ncbi:MAG TPA: cysteate synthase [Chitinophagales bacterium]|nr:cysteate synthase [Chitinophagales bacterium]
MKNPVRLQAFAESFKTDYCLRLPGTNKIISDDGFILYDQDYPGALFRAEYAERHLRVGDDRFGIYKYACWLPVNHFLSGSSAPVTYKSEGLAKFLKLKHLYITFSGYWPQRDAYMLSGTFKECEAFAVCGRLPEGFDNVLVVASAGNTARAFARVCSENHIRLLLVVPDSRRAKLWFREELNPCVKLVTVGGNSDYYDAIRIADEVCKLPGFVAEGGARNVARRDGMGTTVLSAVTTIGEIPDYYFQAVGSGTGAIAAWEANLRFIESGEYGRKKMSLQVSQNEPFTPMYDAWKEGSRQLLPMDESESKKKLSQIYADVLANRRPPYSVQGGLYDALVDSSGDMHSVTNEEAKYAAKIFLQKEGIDIEPAAAVATASLIKCAEEGTVSRNSIIMLNITGGGIQRFKNEHPPVYLQPSFVADIGKFDAKHDVETIAGLFAPEKKVRKV